jgi:hypothetical protein
MRVGAGPGVPPNPNSDRSKRRGITVIEGNRNLTDLPLPPAGLSDPNRVAWAAFWHSPLAAAVIETDLPALRRLFEMYQRREDFDTAGMVEPVVVGSQKQEVLSALLKEVDVLDAKILALEDRFGMSPLSRLRLQVKVGDASRSIAATNARLAAGALDTPDDDEIDLRKPAGRVPRAKV